MEINLIWCQTTNLVIGQKTNDEKYYMPWDKNKIDINHFVEKTSGHAVLMGYNTYKSLNLKPLKNRINYILTNSHYDELNVLFDEQNNPNEFIPVKTIDNCINLCEFNNIDELWIIGGKQLYTEMIYNSKYRCKIDNIWITTLYDKVINQNENTISFPICYMDIINLNFKKVYEKVFDDNQKTIICQYQPIKSINN